MKKLLSTRLHINFIRGSFMFYWLLAMVFYMAAFIYILWRIAHPSEPVSPREVAGGIAWYKLDAWLGFKRRRRFFINKQILARH